MALTAHLSTSSPKLVSGLSLASIWVLFASIARELRHRLLCYSQPTWPTFHWKCGFKSLLIQHLQPSESLFRSCGSPTRNNNLFTTIGPRKKPKGLLSLKVMPPLCAPWICVGLLLIAPSRSLVLALAVFSLFHGFCFVPWVLPCYRPEKERFSSQELSFPIISALRVFEKKCAGLLLIAPFRSLAAGNNFSHRISSQEFSIRNDFGPFATI